MKKLILSLFAALALSACNPQSVYHHWTETPPEVQAEHPPEVIQAWIDAYWEARWVEAYWANYWRDVVAWSEAYEAAQRAAQIPPCHSPNQKRCSVQGIEVCNGEDLPTCGIVYRESRFNPNAANPRSSARQLYQFLRSTWNSICPEYPHGRATVTQQVDCARRLWDWGRGARHWRLTL